MAKTSTLRFTIPAALLAFSSASVAEAPILPMNEVEESAPALPDILTMRERAKVIDDILAERLETVIPQIMREEGVDLWLLMSRE